MLTLSFSVVDTFLLLLTDASFVLNCLKHQKAKFINSDLGLFSWDRNGVC